MAATYHAFLFTIYLAPLRSMADIYNAAGSSKVVRLYRMWLWNRGTGSITGGMTTFAIRRITFATGGTTVSTVKHDTNSPALDANTTIGTDRSVQPAETFRRFPWLIEEISSAGATDARGWHCLVPIAEIWNLGYGDTTVQPITCRAGYGVDLALLSNFMTHYYDVELEFTSV